MLTEELSPVREYGFWISAVLHHPERLAEQPGGDETGLARDARLLPLREEAGILPVVQVKDMAMLRRVCEGGATALVGSYCFHASLD